jgi:hypothetical protein
MFAFAGTGLSPSEFTNTQTLGLILRSACMIADGGFDRNDVAGIGGVAHFLETFHCEIGEKAHHSLYRGC